MDVDREGLIVQLSNIVYVKIKGVTQQRPSSSSPTAPDRKSILLVAVCELSTGGSSGPSDLHSASKTTWLQLLIFWESLSMAQ
jgi:hypothetical protein